MARREIKFEGPVHTIFEGKENWEGYKDKDVIAIAYESRNYGTLHRFYTLGSVVGYALDNCDCPFERFERAKSLGHPVHLASQNSTMITSGERPREYSYMQEHGDIIKFHGKMFKIVPQSNDNIGLELVE